MATEATTLLPLLLAIVAVAAVVAGGLYDIRTYHIPDVLTIILLASAAGFGLLTPGFDWVSHLAAPAIMFGIGIVAFNQGWFGGGDIKLLTGVAAWTGLGGLAPQEATFPVDGLLLLLVLVSFAGAGLVLILLAARRALAGGDPAALAPMLRQDGPVPYAVAIAIGTIWWASLAGPSFAALN